MRRLLAALLPAEAREHVLGDLEQTKFKARDLAGLLPRVWYSHFRRRWFGPIPNLAAASADQLRDRCVQIQRGQGLIIFWLILVRFVVSAIEPQKPFWSISPRFEFWFAGTLVILMVLGLTISPVLERRRQVRGPDYWRKRYLATLRTQAFFFQPYIFRIWLAIGILELLALPGFPLQQHGIGRVIVGILAIGAALLFGRWSQKRLTRELRHAGGTPASALAIRIQLR